MAANDLASGNISHYQQCYLLNEKGMFLPLKNLWSISVEELCNTWIQIVVSFPNNDSAYIDESRYSSALAMGLRFSCINLSMYGFIVRNWSFACAYWLNARIMCLFLFLLLFM